MPRIEKTKVALFGHPADIPHLKKCIHSVNPEVTFHSDILAKKVFEWTPSHVSKRFDSPILQNKERQVFAFHTLITFLAEMIHLSLREIVGKIRQGFEAAVKEGATYVGLGAFTSIACIGRESRLEKEYDVRITSGNTLTAALAIEQVKRAADSIQLPLEESTVAIIGASGDIGSGCTLALKDQVKKLFLTAKGMNRLKRIMEKLIQNSKAEIKLCDQIPDALSRADIVIATASATEVLIFSENVRPGTIICDIAFPKSISEKILTREDVLAFAGGIASIPTPMDFGYYMALPNINTTFGCFAEALILAMEGVRQPFSHGRGNITLEKMDYILRAAAKYDIKPAGFYAGEKLIDKERLDRVMTSRKNRDQCRAAC